MMSGLTADQIIERLANANGVEPSIMRQQIEQAFEAILSDTTQPHSFMLTNLLSCEKPTVEEMVVALEYALYDMMMPILPGWEWDGEGYRNTSMQKSKE